MKTKQTNMKTHHGAWGSTLMVLLWLAANICAAEVPVVIALDNPVPRLAAVKTTSTSASPSIESLKKELRQVQEERRDVTDRLSRREKEWNLSRISLEQRVVSLGEEKEGLALRLNEQVAALNGVIATLRNEAEETARENAQLKRRYQTAVREHAKAEDEWRTAARAMDQRLARLQVEQERLQQWVDDEVTIRGGGALRENMDNEWNAALVGSLNDIGLLMVKDGQLDQAEAFFKRALTILDQTSEHARAASGTLLQHLADVAWMKGDLVSANHYYADAEQVFARTVGPKNRRYAAVLNGWAGVLQRQKKFGEAEDKYRQAIKVYEQKRSGDPVGLAVVLHNLGLLLMDQDRLSEAGPLLEKSVALLTGDGDANSLHAMRAFRSLGHYYRLAGNLEQATACELQANELAMHMMME